MGARHFYGAILCFVVGVLAASAHAQSASPVQLEYVAVEPCPGRDRVEADIAALLQGSTASPTRVTLGISRAEDVFVASIAMGEARRELRAHACEDLVHASTLVIAMAVDPAAAAANSETDAPSGAENGGVLGDPAQAVEAPADPDVAASTEIASPPAEASVPSAPLRVSPILGADINVVAGVLPREAFALDARAGVRLGVLEIGASFMRTFHADGSIAEVSGAGGSFRWTMGALDVGVPFEFGFASLVPHASFGLGVIDWESFGVSHPSSGTSFWAHASVGGEVRFRITSWLSAAVFADLLVPLLRPVFFLEDLPGTSDVHRASAITGVLGIGLRVP